MQIPFKDFTQLYDSVTGNPIKTCQDNPVNCVFFNPETLKKIAGISFWAEGATGKFQLEVKEISACGCNAQDAVKLAVFNNNILIGISWYGLLASIGLCAL